VLDAVKVRFAQFLRSVARSEDGRRFASAYVVAAFESPESRIVIDTKTQPAEGGWFAVHVDDEWAPVAEVTFSAEPETYDLLLRGDLGMMFAVTSRRISVEGKLPRAMRLIPAFEMSLPFRR
jgi:putative sterol carrier protein